jgi:hypothetical protein
MESEMTKRTLDTMSDAIALSSPSGRMSKRALIAAQKKLSLDLFGPNGLEQPKCKQPTEKESLLRHAAQLRDLAARGMRPRAFIKDAAMLEERAALLPD